MKIEVDIETCCSSGMCVERAPGIFTQRENDGVVVLLVANPVEESWDAARSAAAACPVSAITISE